jgi:hypothetical protein
MMNACTSRRLKRPLTRGCTRQETSVREIGLFHNGTLSLPIVTDKDGATPQFFPLKVIFLSLTDRHLKLSRHFKGL